jgi:hypothetical protein
MDLNEFEGSSTLLNLRLLRSIHKIHKMHKVAFEYDDLKSRNLKNNYKYKLLYKNRTTQDYLSFGDFALTQTFVMYEFKSIIYI